MIPKSGHIGLTELMAFQQTATEIVQSTNKEVADARGHSVVVVLIQELEQPCGESLLLIVRVDNIVPHELPTLPVLQALSSAFVRAMNDF